MFADLPLGGNVAILAAADAAIRREALTTAVASAIPLLQGALLVLMLAVAAAATVAGDRAVLGVGLWSWLLLAIYLLCIGVVRRTRGQEPWVPQDRKERPAGGHGKGGEETADGSLVERRHAMIMHMGVDSLLVIGTYPAGVAVLYSLR